MVSSIENPSPTEDVSTQDEKLDTGVRRRALSGKRKRETEQRDSDFGSRNLENQQDQRRVLVKTYSLIKS